MPSEPVYREARMGDSAAIAGLISDLGYPTSPRQMQARLRSVLSDKSYATFVAVMGTRVVGFVGLHVGPLYESDSRYGQIMAIAVSRDHRRAGIGRRLMEMAEDTMHGIGARTFVLGSGNHRKEAHSFYEALGYEFTGRRYKKSA